MIGDATLDGISAGTSQTLVNYLLPLIQNNLKYIVSICGESGSGKTVTALGLKQQLKQNGIAATILHMDDYFYLPPRTNHQHRLENSEHVGFSEVNLELLSMHALEFKSGISWIEKPLVYYTENTILTEQLDLENIRVLIVEGTYSFLIGVSDFNVFMMRNYKETEELRYQRSRGNEMEDPFNEVVLEREHHLIAPLIQKAHAVIDYDFNVKLVAPC